MRDKFQYGYALIGGRRRRNGAALGQGLAVWSLWQHKFDGVDMPTCESRGSSDITSGLTALQLPQLIQNYKSQNAEGLSMAFLFVWLLGDVANLAGW